jgi:glycosyltransferase involved in cell wall biosynthesis
MCSPDFAKARVMGQSFGEDEASGREEASPASSVKPLDGVLLLSPILPPAPGGAAQYVNLLARGLIRHEITRRVVVVSEQHPQRASVEFVCGDRIVFQRIYPYRAGRSQKDLRSYLSYLVQNFQLLMLPELVREQKIDAVIVHASFHLHVSTTALAIWRLRRLGGPGLRIIADVRDPKLPVSKLRELCAYDAVICCCERVAHHVAQERELAPKIRLIPIPFVPRRPTPQEVQASLAAYGLEAERFFFFPHGISIEKGIEQAITALQLLGDARAGMPLIVAGKARDTSPLIRSAIAQGIVRYLGTLTNEEVIALSKASRMVLNVSPIEALPRSGLEAIGAGARILLPWGIPELERLCPDYVLPALDAATIARRILEVLPLPPPDYPVEDHHPDKLMPAYQEVLTSPTSRP